MWAFNCFASYAGLRDALSPDIDPPLSIADLLSHPTTPAEHLPGRMKILCDQRRFMEIEGFGGVPAGFNRAEAEVIAEERFFGDAEFDAKLGHDVDFMAAFGGIIPAQKDRIDFFILIQRGGGLDAVAQDAGRFSVQVKRRRRRRSRSGRGPFQRFRA